ncbi:MAG: hypothetical protein COS14_13700 [Bacteroidetes bacterium CG02_land_8_20_14_3_00_31_25]|nr:hypothetical protein [Bacteroidota bacterium]PIV57648.1 MAG: hypothetical protein COS14_13700 [Bacteroidetes bacterium CG02_land_8_20_14_3_00_31_25]PIX32755.1 MAG: hypothetical protein COZ59_12325 [Bacteroidetes bacterium CG_4_8_14_3_um_filter_31_14]PIY04805.1 MAG: hypothetical protein COZ21_05585 [Bacteroidetes bacterium CG_4_10_14_3_um_filter_31_20]
MNKIKYETKLSCMLFGCPMVEELKSCSISNLRLLTSSQPFYVEEKIETSFNNSLLSPKYICLNKDEK